MLSHGDGQDASLARSLATLRTDTAATGTGNTSSFRWSENSTEERSPLCPESKEQTTKRSRQLPDEVKTPDTPLAGIIRSGQTLPSQRPFTPHTAQSPQSDPHIALPENFDFRRHYRGSNAGWSDGLDVVTSLGAYMKKERTPKRRRNQSSIDHQQAVQPEPTSRDLGPANDMTSIPLPQSSVTDHMAVPSDTTTLRGGPLLNATTIVTLQRGKASPELPFTDHIPASVITPETSTPALASNRSLQERHTATTSEPSSTPRCTYASVIPLAPEARPMEPSPKPQKTPLEPAPNQERDVQQTLISFASSTSLTLSESRSTPKPHQTESRQVPQLPKYDVPASPKGFTSLLPVNLLPTPRKTPEQAAEVRRACGQPPPDQHSAVSFGDFRLPPSPLASPSITEEVRVRALRTAPRPQHLAISLPSSRHQTRSISQLAPERESLPHAHGSGFESTVPSALQLHDEARSLFGRNWTDWLRDLQDPFTGTPEGEERARRIRNHWREFEPGQGRPLQSMTNIGLQNSQPRGNASARLQNAKPTTWAQAGILGGQSAAAQARDTSTAQENSWAQTMGGSRPNTQLDLSSSSFPSLNNSGQQSQSFNPGSSAWQTGPPQSEQGRRQPLQSARPQMSTRQQQGPGAEGFYPTDTFSRNAPMEYSMSDHNSQANRRSSVAPSGPPGLVQRPTQMTNALSGDPSRITSPAGTGQDSRSPISQGLNGAIGQERPMVDAGISNESRRPQVNDYLQQSPPTQLPREAFAPRETFDQTSEHTPESIFAGMSEKDKFGMKGYLALAEGPNPTFRNLMRGQDLAALGLNMNSDAPLLASYAGPFALPNAHPLRPLDADYNIPDCYTVKKVAPLHSRINSFSDETLFYIFYSMPRDYMQVLVGQELMERKWRYHMREQMWMMRDESSGSYVMNDDRMSEHGYYIWWDKNVWKKVRRAYTLRYEDLDDVPSVGNNRRVPGMAGGVNGDAAGGIFNAVPGLEKMAAAGRGF